MASRVCNLVGGERQGGRGRERRRGREEHQRGREGEVIESEREREKGRGEEVEREMRVDQHSPPDLDVSAMSATCMTVS